MPHKAQYPVKRTFYCTRQMSEDIDKFSAQFGMGKSELIRRAIATYIVEKIVNDEPQTKEKSNEYITADMGISIERFSEI